MLIQSNLSRLVVVDSFDMHRNIFIITIIRGETIHFTSFHTDHISLVDVKHVKKKKKCFPSKLSILSPPVHRNTEIF